MMSRLAYKFGLHCKLAAVGEGVDPLLHTSPMQVREMRAGDADAVAAIYNEGVAERATFRPGDASGDEVVGWLDRAERFPILVAERDDRVAGWARVTPYSEFAPYAGVGELGIYVTRTERGNRVAHALVAALCTTARERGYWKLTAKVFPDNEASLRLLRGLGFRDVGLHVRHGRHADGEWRDVLLLERSL